MCGVGPGGAEPELGAGQDPLEGRVGVAGLGPLELEVGGGAEQELRGGANGEVRAHGVETELGTGVVCAERNPSRQPHPQTSLPTEEAALLAPGLQVHHTLPEQHNQQILQGGSFRSQLPQTLRLQSPVAPAKCQRLIPSPHPLLALFTSKPSASATLPECLILAPHFPAEGPRVT